MKGGGGKGAGRATEELLRQLERARRRIDNLHRSARGGDPDARDALIEEMLEELYGAFEELRVSEEELGAQSESLAEARAQLTAERERYSALFDFAPGPYLTTDQTGRIRAANRAASRLLRLDPPRLRGKSLADFVTRADQSRFRSLLRAVLRKGHMEEFELTVLPSPDAPHPVPVSISVAAGWEPGKGLLWLLRDISERKSAERNALLLAQAQAAQAEAELASERISNILESISDAFVALDAGARITYLNRRAEQLLERSRNELLGKRLWDAFPELVGSVFEREYHRAIEEEVPIAIEEYYPAARIWVELHAFPTPDGLTVYFRNVTRRKRADEIQRFLARASEELATSIDYAETLRRVAYLAVPQMADSCVVYTTNEQGEIYRAVAVHADAAKQARLDRLLDVSPIPPTSRANPVARAVRSGRPEWIAEVDDEVLAALATDADHLEVLRRLNLRTLIVVPLVSRDRTLGAISLGCETAERHYTQEDLGLAEELARRAALAIDNARLYAQAQQAAGAREDILNVVSHDLRNALNALLLHTDVLLAGTPPVERRERGRKQVEAIQRSANQMYRLVQDLLDAESVAAGRLSIHPEPIEVPRLVHEVVAMLHPVAEEKAIEITAEIAAELPVLHADRGRIEQVLNNLVGNAVKFSEPGDRVTLGARRAADSTEICFWVADTGCGIPPEELPHVFTRYWQGRISRQLGRGAGLGLTIAKGIVEAHGGRIWAESPPGTGSTFYFTLPVEREDGTEQGTGNREP